MPPLNLNSGESHSPVTREAPLRVMFVMTSMPVGGAETLLANLVRRCDRNRLAPEIVCLKEPGPLGEILAEEIPLHHHLLRNKYDLRVLLRLKRLMQTREIDAVVTVGAGDKMFWGRLAARWAKVPVIVSALHSTGWPDCVGRLNRWLTPLTNAFVAVAHRHGEYLVEQERFPEAKVRVIPNGIDTTRFTPNDQTRQEVRASLGLESSTPVLGIVAALRPEKDHLLLLRAMRQVVSSCPTAQLLIVGEGPVREEIESHLEAWSLTRSVRLLGNRSDIPELLSALDLFVLSSKMEANPVSILEAMATGLPVVVPRVGSIPEMVTSGETGILYTAGEADELAEGILSLLEDPSARSRMGELGRVQAQEQGSLEAMVSGYQQLLEELYEAGVRPKTQLSRSETAKLPSPNVS